MTQYLIKSLRSLRRHKANGAVFHVNSLANIKPGENPLDHKSGWVPPIRVENLGRYITGTGIRMHVRASYPDGRKATASDGKSGRKRPSTVAGEPAPARSEVSVRAEQVLAIVESERWRSGKLARFYDDGSTVPGCQVCVLGALLEVEGIRPKYPDCIPTASYTALFKDSVLVEHLAAAVRQVISDEELAAFERRWQSMSHYDAAQLVWRVNDITPGVGRDIITRALKALI